MSRNRQVILGVRWSKCRTGHLRAAATGATGRRDQTRVRTIRVHDVQLAGRAAGLVQKRDIFAIWGPVWNHTMR